VSVYLDASVLIPTIVTEQASAAVDGFLLENSDDRLVSEFAVAEVGSALSRLVRMGRIDPTDAADRLVDFDEWRAGMTDTVDLGAQDCRLANTYVRRFGLMLRAPDALHIAICRRLDLMLVTLDRRMATAARELGLYVSIPAV
jgi:uncharacterized protein